MRLAVEHRVVEQLRRAERGVLVEQHRAEHRLLGLVAPGRRAADVRYQRSRSCRAIRTSSQVGFFQFGLRSSAAGWYVTISGMPLQRCTLLAQLAQALPHAQHRLGRRAAQREDHLRPDQLDLAVEIRKAGRDLVGQRLPVLRRTALHDVGDVDRSPRELRSPRGSLSSSSPACPTNGRPVASSVAPGPSPTSTSRASGLPSPGTALVRVGAERAAVGGTDPLRHRVDASAGRARSLPSSTARCDGEADGRESPGASGIGGAPRQPTLALSAASAGGSGGASAAAADAAKRLRQDHFLGAAQLGLLRQVPSALSSSKVPLHRVQDRLGHLALRLRAAGSAACRRAPGSPPGWCRPRSRRPAPARR